MFFRARQGLNWHETISSTKASGEVFAWLDAAMLALGFERQFGPSEMLYRRDDQEVRLDLRPSAAGTMATFFGIRRKFSLEERAALQLAAQAKLSDSALPGFVAPHEPWLTPDQVVSPYPRRQAKRGRWQGLLASSDKQISFHRLPEVIETQFRPDCQQETAVQRLRAIAHLYSWQETPGTESELNFVRGNPQVASSDTGLFALPALLRVYVDPKSNFWTVRLVVWGTEWSPTIGGPRSEVEAIRAFVRAGIRPDGLVRAVGIQQGAISARLRWTILCWLIGAGVVFTLILPVSGLGPTLAPCFLALMAPFIVVISKLQFPARYDPGPESLSIENFDAERAPSPTAVPQWAKLLVNPYADHKSQIRKIVIK